MQFNELAKDYFDTMLSCEHAPSEPAKPLLPRGELAILVYLATHRDGANVGELTDFLQVTSGRTATTLNALERKGFVKRMTDADDSRRICVFLTDAGRCEFQSGYKRAIEKYTDFFQKLGEEDSREFIRMMKKVHFG